MEAPLLSGTTMTARRRLEAKLRRVVIERLAIDPAALAPGVSLTDDLAADSLDLAEIAVAVDEELGVVLERSALDAVRSFDDLVDVVVARQGLPPAPGSERPLVRVRIATPGAVVERALALTPYAAELIASDALRAGPGASLELTLLGDHDEAAWSRAATQFSRLAARGVLVHLVRESRRPSGRHGGIHSQRGPSWGRGGG